MGVDRGVAFMQRILIGDALKKYREFLVGSRQLVRELDGDEWNLRKLGGHTDTKGHEGYLLLAQYKCVNFKR